MFLTMPSRPPNAAPPAGGARPVRLHLPSGQEVAFARRRVLAGEEPAVDLPFAAFATPVVHADAFTLDGSLVLTTGGGRALDVDALSLEDFHVLRTVATALGFFAEPPVVRRCANCDDTFPVALSASVPLGPILDGELSDEELDEPFDFDKEHDLLLHPTAPAPSTAPRRAALSPLTVGQARALWAVLVGHEGAAGDRRRVARHLGLRSLDGRPYGTPVVRALRAMDDETWDALLDLFEAAHYSPRIDAHVRCPHCEAENTYRAPRLREFPEIEDDRAIPLDEGRATAGFPSPDAFLAAMEEFGKELYEEADVVAVPLFLELEVPHVDDGGQPLLGSYTPPAEGAAMGASGGEIRLYYRTFKKQWADLGPYDVDAEIRETIEHELAHHTAFLRGYDETDEEERAAIVRERERVVGKHALARQERAAEHGHGGLPRSWPLWVIAALLVLFGYLSLRG
jgi:hypothetical protein